MTIQEVKTEKKGRFFLIEVPENEVGRFQQVFYDVITAKESLLSEKIFTLSVMAGYLERTTEKTEEKDPKGGEK